MIRVVLADDQEIKNTKTVDPADPDSPEVIQIETAMGAAIEVFDDAQVIEVPRDRFVPVKTTNDLLVIRSDCYDVDEDYVLQPLADPVPFVDLDPTYYKLVDDFEARFPEGIPSLRGLAQLIVNGDWTFGADVRVVGEAVLADEGRPGYVGAGSTLG